MERYTVVVQTNAGAGPDHWMGIARAKDADDFAKWVHKETGAAVNVYDQQHARSRLTLGNFDEGRT